MAPKNPGDQELQSLVRDVEDQTSSKAAPVLSESKSSSSPENVSFDRDDPSRLANDLEKIIK